MAYFILLVFECCDNCDIALHFSTVMFCATKTVYYVQL